MSLNDGVSDLITRIRNAYRASLPSTSVLASKVNRNILNLLKESGYIASFTQENLRNNVYIIFIKLKYKHGIPGISEIKRVSKPGRRVYNASTSLPVSYNNYGIYIVSTSKGIVTDADARKMGIGGEVMVRVF